MHTTREITKLLFMEAKWHMNKSSCRLNKSQVNSLNSRKCTHFFKGGFVPGVLNLGLC